MSFQFAGTFNAGVVGAPGVSSGMQMGVPTMDAAGIASGGAFLTSELEKHDPIIRKPLTSFTYPRDIVIETGGGWSEYVSATDVSYGVTGGSGSGPVQAGSSNGIPIVQASLSKGIYKTHAFSLALRIPFIDMQRANFTGRSLEQLLQDGVRLVYDKHQDQNIYEGLDEYDTTGLINDPNATESTVADGTSGNGNWETKTPIEILKDVNTALTQTWAQAGYDESAIPNHILIPYEELTYLMNTPVSDLATKSIYQYIMENNITNKKGGDLFIGGTMWCKGAGTGGTDRMVVYCNDRRFVKADELSPLARIMSQPVATLACYDTTYMANLSQVEMFYPQTITYWDQIGGDA